MTEKKTTTNINPEHAAPTDDGSVKERFPVTAMRLLLAEYARAQGIGGYIKLATQEDEPGTNNTWSVLRTESKSDESGAVTVPALILLRVERGRYKRMEAFSELRKLNGELAQTAVAIKARQHKHTTDPVEVAKQAAELKALLDKQQEMQIEAENLAKLYETPNTQDFYFPIDCPFKEFPLAPLSV
jgi:hypothetical protein